MNLAEMRRSYLSLTALLPLISSSMATHQVLLGPAFATPSNLAESDVIQSTARLLSTALEETVTQGKNAFGNFTGNSTSLSLTVVSAENSTPLLDFNFASPFLNTTAGSVSHVDADSIYRIGSISKLFTVYSLLLNNGSEYWNRPVTDFIPELRDAAAQSAHNFSATDQVQWNQVSIGALASQLSGVGRECRSTGGGTRG